jgi:hypothetical protein
MNAAPEAQKGQLKTGISGWGSPKDSRKKVCHDNLISFLAPSSLIVSIIGN